MLTLFVKYEYKKMIVHVKCIVKNKKIRKKGKLLYYLKFV